MSKHYQNLLAQLDKLHRHNRQGSFRTKQRYYEAMQRFCRFLAEQYHLERLANIAPKHIGLRHTCAAEWYKDFIQQHGQSPYQARKSVSKLLGHGRDDVTRIYLASLKEGSQKSSYKCGLSSNLPADMMEPGRRDSDA